MPGAEYVVPQGRQDGRAGDAAAGSPSTDSTTPISRIVGCERERAVEIHFQQHVRAVRADQPARHREVALGAITGGLDFSNYYLPLSAKVQAGLSYADAKKQGAVLGYGQFLTVAINFLIIAFVLFLAIRGLNKMKKKEEAKPAEPSATEKLLAEIRDLLARRA